MCCAGVSSEELDSNGKFPPGFFGVRARARCTPREISSASGRASARVFLKLNDLSPGEEPPDLFPFYKEIFTKWELEREDPGYYNCGLFIVQMRIVAEQMYIINENRLYAFSVNAIFLHNLQS